MQLKIRCLFYKLQGFSLLEVMLAVALIGLGLVLSLGLYQKIVVKRNVAQIQNSVLLLGNALEQYYNVNCYWFLSDKNSYDTTYTIPLTTNPLIVPAPTDNSPNPTLVDYIPNAGWVNNPYVPQSLGPAAYTYTIDVRTDVPVLSISTQFPQTMSQSFLSSLQAMLKPTLVNKYTFSWDVALNQPLKTQATGLKTNLSYLETLTTLFLSTGDRQYGMQYLNTTRGIAQFSNVCAYWQRPQNRCEMTGNPARCTYLYAP